MKSWKTTLAGILVGLVPIAETVLKMAERGEPIDWAKVALGAGIAVLGLVAKDHNVSGTGVK